MQGLEKDFKQIAINALANQAERESLVNLASSSSVTQKIIGDLSMIKIRESRKRLRPKDFNVTSTATGAFTQLNAYDDSDDDDIVQESQFVF